MKIRKFAAIDIGSNAVRLLVANIIEKENDDPKFKKSALVRVPIRLGEDSFTKQMISDEKASRMIEAMKAYKILMGVHGVEDYMACATSAMREANNGQDIIKKIKKKTGIQIDIIDGKREAEIIASTDLRNVIQKEKAYLYVDVGGGSTEFTVFNSGKIQVSKSFKIGTVRILNNMVDDKMWNEVEKWIKKHTKGLKRLSLIGSGGNINKLHKMSGRGIGEPLSYIYLNAQYQFLLNLSYNERVSELGLNPDRADVIIPATKIYLAACKWSGARKIYVPKIGLADGIIKTLYFETSKKEASETNIMSF